MKIALVCPASLPATQFGGILFLCVDIAKETSNNGNDVTIYTTDLDFANNPNTFNRDLPNEEIIDNFNVTSNDKIIEIEIIRKGDIVAKKIKLF